MTRQSGQLRRRRSGKPTPASWVFHPNEPLKTDPFSTKLGSVRPPHQHCKHFNGRLGTPRQLGIGPRSRFLWTENGTSSPESLRMSPSASESTRTGFATRMRCCCDAGGGTWKPSASNSDIRLSR